MERVYGHAFPITISPFGTFTKWVFRVPIKNKRFEDKDAGYCQYKIELEIIKNHHGENSEESVIPVSHLISD